MVAACSGVGTLNESGATEICRPENPSNETKEPIRSLPNRVLGAAPSVPLAARSKWGIVSYDHRLLCERITRSLHGNPSISLRELCRELRVSRRTIQNAVNEVKGKSFRDLREEVLLLRVKTLLALAPKGPIRRISLEAGYKSSRSFARAVRRACGVSPRQLRSRIARELLASEAQGRFSVVPL